MTSSEPGNAASGPDVEPGVKRTVSPRVVTQIRPAVKHHSRGRLIGVGAQSTNSVALADSAHV